jgi:hypothetical protein
MAAFESLRTLVAEVDQKYAQDTRKILILIGKKCGLLATVRRDAQLKAFLDIWLRIHVPMTAALIISLIIHIFSVFYYW